MEMFPYAKALWIKKLSASPFRSPSINTLQILQALCIFNNGSVPIPVPSCARIIRELIPTPRPTGALP
jgi:hypothetical protein